MCAILKKYQEWSRKAGILKHRLLQNENNFYVSSAVQLPETLIITKLTVWEVSVSSIFQQILIKIKTVIKYKLWTYPLCSFGMLPNTEVSVQLLLNDLSVLFLASDKQHLFHLLEQSLLHYLVHWMQMNDLKLEINSCI